jgi:hypothetical protein
MNSLSQLNMRKPNLQKSKFSVAEQGVFDVWPYPVIADAFETDS